MDTRPATHDYTNRFWGHDYIIHSTHDGGQQITMSGWGAGIRAGNYLILKNGNESTRYQVQTIAYHADPPDMWRAEATFAPR